ncbi:glycoside hydrolase [Aliiglaciecola sp. CAU 1673]|uniref:endo-beta-N-acetylglucosaminidase n=1 Tax=Aliiglaciecola sp. CAU 1673 TaxID=3032595 RepID=UPI0023DA195E|nr:glycoside hydrolase [Aliiglaciecola sp. CAU 1673]MDF2178603.1 glycoside hydrolase [Aliiglaciecola sp. CAU 1673]
MKRIALLLGLLLSPQWLWADIQANQPPFALSVQQLSTWSADSPLADADNRSTQPVLPRRVALLSGQEDWDNQARVLYAPDGMNNFANYLHTQDRFNLYNFTHWSQIHLLNWFAGTADHNVQIPARPWVDIAHQNGVKVLGSVFLAVAQWGGSADTAEALLVKDQQGNFPLADKLIQIAGYYGFDGWLINQETDLTAVKDASNHLLEGQSDPERGQRLAARMLEFLHYLTAKAPQGMEIHWYDAMVASGEVRWQNRLNKENTQYLGSADNPASDAIFINYWWDQKMVRASYQQALALGRSPYAVFTGADLWPDRNAQRAFSRHQWLDWLFADKQALTSIALFAPNVNFNFSGNAHTPAFADFEKQPGQWRAFYATETRLFAGDDLNLAKVDSAGWKGLGAYLPAHAVALGLPFMTHFNTGQGLHWWQQGEKTGGSWTQMANQEPLPTWQFALVGERAAELFFDFETAYQGGSSLALVSPQSAKTAQAPLYAVDFIPSADSQLKLMVKGKARGVSLYFLDEQGRGYDYGLQDTDQWQAQTFSLSALAGKSIKRIGLQLAGGEAVDLRLGLLEVTP